MHSGEGHHVHPGRDCGRRHDELCGALELGEGGVAGLHGYA